MSSNACNIYGANYEHVDGRWKCPACGAYKPEELSNEEVTLLYNAAQKLRLGAFDDAEAMYRDIVKKYRKNSSAFWGLVLAKYGIKYEEDYDGKMIPSCYAASYESVLNDKDYNRALEFATEENRKYYELQAQKIEAIRKEWVDKASKEPPYDVFISFKDTDLGNSEERTKDSYEAYELYTHLKEKGYRVFFSRESLKNKTGEKYEPYIFNALNTAQVMIVYGSKPEYIESTWVRNEWLRYYKRCKSGEKQKDSLVVVYHGFNPSKLPAPLPALQHINRESITWLQTLDAYVDRVIKASKTNIPKFERTEIKARTGNGKKEVAKLSGVQVTKIKGATASIAERETIQTRELGVYAVPKLNTNAEKLLKIANVYLQSGNFDDAEKTFDNFLINNAQNGDALLGKMLAQTNCCNLQQFQAEGVIKFDNLQLLNEIIAYSEKSVAEEILIIICRETERRFEIKDYSSSKELYGQICSVDYAGVKTLRENLYKKSLSLLSHDEVKYFIDTALLYEQDGKCYAEKLHKVFESYIEIGGFSPAEEYLKKLFECDEANLQTQIGRLQIKFKAKNLGIVFDYCEVHNCYAEAEAVLHSVDEEGANNLLCAFANRCVANVKSDIYNIAYKWFNLFSKYQFTQRGQFLQNIATLCIQNPKEQGIEIFESVAVALSDGDAKEYAKLYYNFAESARTKGLFPLAISCYEKAIEYGEDNIPAYIGKLFAEIKCISEQKLSECIINLQSYETLEIILTLSESDKNRIEFLSEFISACIANVKNAQKVGKEVFVAFEKLLSYIPENYDEKVLYFVNEMARICLAHSLFEQAERYFAMSAGINADDHTVYWGLLQAKLKCKTDEELIKQTEYISEFQEFQNALLASASNSAAMQHYIDVQNRQKIWIEEQEKKRIREKKRNKILKIVSSVLAAVIAVGGAITGTVLWYKSENLLKYEEVQGGYAIDSGIFYKYSVSGVFEIPSGYNGKPIVEISENAFKNFDNVTEFIIPYTVSKISDNAFTGCDNLQKITFAHPTGRAAVTSNLTEIGVRAFYDCIRLTDFSIPYGVTTIGDEAFVNNAFTKLDISNTVEYIGASAFANCENLSKITVGDRENVPTEWHGDWNKNCSAKVEFSLRVQLAANGGDLSQTEQYVIYNEAFNFPVPTKAGYTFEGWYRDDIKLTDEEGSSLKVWNFVDGGTLSARWTANENKIVFNGNGATGGSMPEQTIKTDDSATLLQNKFTRAGYTFAGWATYQSGLVVYADKATYKMGTDSSYTLYATWLANENTLNFDGNGATSGSMSEQTVRTNASVTLKSNAFVRAGYDFMGWSTSPYGTVIFKDGATYKMGAESSYTLYAVWRLHDYSIAYNLNGGTVSGNPTQYNVESDTFTLVNPTRAGYTFAGWTGTGITSATQTVTVAKGSIGDRIYTATWTTKLNTITFHANGGEGEMPQQQIATDSTAALSNNTFIRTGYDFIGWATSENGAVVYANGASYTMGTNSNYDLYAVWRSNLFKYEVTDHVKITKYIGTLPEVEIPTSLEGKSVTEIGTSAFDNCNYLTSITIPENINAIGKYAFRNCTALEEIKFNAINCKDLERGDDVFYNAGKGTDGLRVVFGKVVSQVPGYLFCSFLSSNSAKISSVDFEENGVCTSIGESAFLDCSSLSSVTIGDSIKDIGFGAFMWCRGLTNITLGKGVTSIRAEAFCGCRALTSITIPESVTKIYSNAFEYCSGLERVVVEQNNTKYHSEGNCIIESASKILIMGCNNSVIPSDGSVTIIGPYAFHNRKGVTNVTIPDNVTSIGDSAFADCSSLTSVIIPDSVTEIGDSAFRSCTSLTSLIIPDSVTCIGGGAFKDCSGLTEIIIPESVVNIGRGAFNVCEGFTIRCQAYNKPNGWDNIWCDARCSVIWACEFSRSQSAEGLTITKYSGDKENLVIPETIDGEKVIVIDRRAFYQNIKIKTVKLPEGLKTIGESAFSECSNLENINLPDSITEINVYAFYKCSALKRVVIPKGMTEIKSSVFGQCTSLEEVTIHDKITNIGNQAFGQCSLKTVYIPTSVIQIDYGAFNGNKDLTIYCEVASKPDGWVEDWNHDNRPVVWGYSKII